MNWVRIPFPFWAISKIDEEPFLEGAAWPYFLRAIAWARKYGLRINLDLHALPGSQNGWNHSGRLGTINVLYGPMGINNAERSLDYIRIISEFISQPESVLADLTFVPLSSDVRAQIQEPRPYLRYRE